MPKLARTLMVSISTETGSDDALPYFFSSPPGCVEIHKNMELWLGHSVKRLTVRSLQGTTAN